MDVKGFADSLDENLFSGKNFKKAYVIYAFWLVLCPIIETFTGLLQCQFDMLTQLFVIMVLYFLTKTLELAFNYREIKITKPKASGIMLLGLFAWFMICTIVNGAFNVNFFFGLGFFVIFMLFLKIDKKHYKTLAWIFVVEMAISSLFGLIDLKNEFIFKFEGFNLYTMSLQFVNPNWSGFVLIIAMIVCLWLLLNSESKLYKSLYLLAYIAMAMALFIGGSYAPETALFLCELALLIYLWIKYKKCPWWILSAMLATIFISFSIWWVPAFRDATTAWANYFYESLGVIDNNLKTNLVETISTFCARIFGGNPMTFIPGSDGWDRDVLNMQALNAIFASPNSFIFGYGSAYVNNIKVHNAYLVLWMEFGLPGLLLFIATCVFLLVRFIKVKKSDLLVFLFSSLIMMLFEFIFCCIEPYCFPFFVMLAAVLYRLIYDAELENKKNDVRGEESKKEEMTPMPGKAIENAGK